MKVKVRSRHLALIALATIAFAAPLAIVGCLFPSLSDLGRCADGGCGGEAGATASSSSRGSSSSTSNGGGGATSSTAGTGGDGLSPYGRAVVYDDHAVAYYPMDESDPDICHDRTGHGHDGRYVGVASPGQPGIPGGGDCFHFDGGGTGEENTTGAYLPADAIDISGVSSFGLEFWMKPTSWVLTEAVAGKNRYDTGPKLYRGLFFTTAEFDAGGPDAGALVLHRTSQLHTYASAISDRELVLDAWVYVVANYDGNNLILYLDGEEHGTTTTDAAIDPDVDNAELHLGNAFHWGTFKGFIDEVATYAKPLPRPARDRHLALGLGSSKHRR